ncbi:sugar kinase [Lapidilactobacillus mulanensis]|uniref:Sugar kinase n=1 Tax=Lapidilactobacillus mulanensis TaxID=2485999 RepID=A0ABW4DQD4_9LACO|nr:sugar kinase [Lapidilactobacillus mulanensis]
MNEFVTIGEPLVVYAADEADVPLNEATHFTRYPAGAELNVTIGLNKLGVAGTYISALGDDSNGRFIRHSLEQLKISTDYIASNKDARTGIYFKERVTHGDPQIEYARANSAASQLQMTDLPKIDFRGVRVLHLTGISAGISHTMFQNVQRLILDAKKAGVTVIFDPNIRPALWPSRDSMIRALNHLAGQCDIVLPGIGEGQILMGSRDPETIADFYLNMSTPKLVVVKSGSTGAFAKNDKNELYQIDAFHVEKVVDTVGAGDGFAAGFISGLLANLPLEQSLRRANAVGALAVQSEGDNSGYPDVEQLETFLQEN